MTGTQHDRENKINTMRFVKMARNCLNSINMLFYKKKHRMGEMDDALKTSLTLGLQCMSKPAAPEHHITHSMISDFKHLTI